IGQVLIDVPWTRPASGPAKRFIALDDVRAGNTILSLMAQINDNYLKLKAGYLFPEIGRRVKAFAAAHPEAKVIRMGIGDVTEPLVPAIVAAMHKAVDEMADRATFKGYGDEQGYGFLREAIAA